MSLFLRAFFLSFLCTAYGFQTKAQIWKKVIPGKDPAAETKLENEAVDKQLRADINYLASDALEGRLTGTNGEMLAGTYIQKRMAQIGLLPYGKSYNRSFKFERGSELSPEVRFSINNRFISVPEDAFPAGYAVGGKDENYVLPDSKEAGSPWVIPLYETENDAKNPNYNWEVESYKKAKAATERGATSVLFYDNYGSKFFPAYKKAVFAGERLNIPVLLVSKKIYDLHITNMKVMQPVLINIAYKKLYKSGTNVMGMINNNATQTVIIAAHYDHLGNGTDFFDTKSNSKAIYNGANDNASGVAAMLALANKLKQLPVKKYNYLFIAFSAEEYGALGSRAFVDASDFSKSDFAYMMDLNMVGRFTATNRYLWVNGVGSSLSWNQALGGVKSNFKLIKDSASVISSDESTFYRIGLPIISFSSGPDPNYHLISDDVPSLNFIGIRDVVDYILGVTQVMETQPTPLFATYQATKIVQEESGKVNFGILPDYNFKDKGVRVDGLISDMPAAKAGILQGDIILQMANFNITDIDSYKKAIANFKTGDQVKVKLKRARSILDFTVLP
jgi:aminopeptidase YwaD